MNRRRLMLGLIGAFGVALLAIAALALTGAIAKGSQGNMPPCVAFLDPVPFTEDGRPIGESNVRKELCAETWEEYVEFASEGAFDVSPDIGEEEALQMIWDYSERNLANFYATQTAQPQPGE